MWIAIAISIVITMIVIVIIFVFVRKLQRNKMKRKEEAVLKGISTNICERLHVAIPNSKWRWVCRPSGFVLNGGIARIEVIEQSQSVSYIDVCLSTNRYMALHLLNVVELTTSELVVNNVNYLNSDNITKTIISSAPKTDIKPYDKESVIKWFNIILFDTLNSIIGDLNANNGVCLYIGKNGEAYTDVNGEKSILHEYGEMPDVSLWDYIIEKLGESGLFAENQNDDCIFISWA